MERGDRSGGDKLENDGVASVFPAKDRAEDDQDEDVEQEDLIPDRFADLVGDVQRDEVGAAGGSVCLERQRDGHAVEESTECDIQDDIVHDRFKLQDSQQKGSQTELQRAVQRKAFAHRTITGERHRDVQGEDAERGREEPATELSDAIQQDRYAGKAGRQQVGRIDEGLDDICLQQRGSDDHEDGEDHPDLSLFFQLIEPLIGIHDLPLLSAIGPSPQAVSSSSMVIRSAA